MYILDFKIWSRVCTILCVLMLFRMVKRGILVNVVNRTCVRGVLERMKPVETVLKSKT